MNNFIVSQKCDWIIQNNASIEEAVIAFDKTKGLPLAVVRKDNTLLGTFSQGDLRKYLQKEKPSLKAKVSEACNKNPRFALDSDSDRTISEMLSGNIQMIPLVDHLGVIKIIAYKGTPKFQIKNHILSKDNNNFLFISEIGVNHNGSYDLAKKLIDESFKAGAHGVKFQFRSDETYGQIDVSGRDLSTEYITTQLQKCKLSNSDEERLIKYAQSLSLIVVVTPFDIKSLQRAIKLDIDCIKIASCDLTNEPLILSAASKNKPLIISTGMSYENEIISTCEIIKRINSNVAFLHTNSTYPCPREDLNLSYINRLSDMTRKVCGYSSHDGSIEPLYVALGCGAKIIEAHITLDKSFEGTDHRASLSPKEIKGFLLNAKTLIHSIGKDEPRCPSAAELLNYESLGKSIHYSKEIKTGIIISEKDLFLASPASGIKWKDRFKIIGKKILEDVKKGQITRNSHFEIDKSNNEKFARKESLDKQFPSKWGLPVRYRDFKKIRSIFNAPLYEFHMSSKDLEIDPRDYLEGIYNAELVIHAVEQYHDGFIIDLASDKLDIINESQQRIKLLIKHVEKLTSYFNFSQKPRIILNCGGFSYNKPIEESKVLEKSDILIENLIEISQSIKDIEIIPQTMPPMPWLQGGTAFHNLLVKPYSIINILKASNLKCCLDTSHTYMASNKYQFDYEAFINKLIEDNLISHIHISDAKGYTEEGLMPGEGEMDFKSIINDLKKHEITFIPEIWQGHSKDFYGFKRSLELILEQID